MQKMSLLISYILIDYLKICKLLEVSSPSNYQTLMCNLIKKNFYSRTSSRIVKSPIFDIFIN